MLDKCANPSCSTPFIYLREGKVFMMEHKSHSRVRPGGPLLVKPASQVEHFWLCGPCSAEMTVTYDRDHGVAVVPKQNPRRTVAS